MVNRFITDENNFDKALLTDGVTYSQVEVAADEKNEKLDSEQLAVQEEKKSLLTDVSKEKENLLQIKKAVAQEINQDQGLDGNQRSIQLAQLRGSYRELLSKISDAFWADKNGSFIQYAEKQLRAQHQPGASVLQWQEASKKVAEDSARLTIEKINQDNTLTSARKSQQIQRVNEALASAENSLTNVNNTGSILAAEHNAVTTITMQHQSENLTKRLQEAQVTLDNLKHETDNQIYAETTLSSVEKQSEYNRVLTEWTKFNQALNGENVSAQNIVDMLASAKIKLVDSFEKGTSLDQVRSEVLSSLKKVYDQVFSKIQSDINLTDAEKHLMTIKLSQALASAKNDLMAMANIQDMMTVKSPAVKAMKAAYRSAEKSRYDRQEDAQAELTSFYQETVQVIQNDQTLDKEQKEREGEKLASLYGQLLKEVTNQDAESQTVINVMTKAREQVADGHIAGLSVNMQKAAANKSLADAVQDVKNLVQRDKTLLTVEKNYMQAMAFAAQTAAEQDVAYATNADEIEIANQNGLAAIKESYGRPAKPATERKSEAVDKLKKRYEKDSQAIASDVLLTSKERAEQLNQLKRDYQAGKTAIKNAAFDVQKITDALNHSLADMRTVHQTAEGLMDQIRDAKNKLKVQAVKEETAIVQDINLTEAEVEAMLSKLDSNLDMALQELSVKPNADAIEEGLLDGKALLSAAKNKPSLSLEKRRVNAERSLAIALENCHSKINSDSTLLSATKRQQLEQVQAVYDQAMTEIGRQNVTSQDVLQIERRTEQEIQNCYRTGHSLEEWRLLTSQTLEAAGNSIQHSIQGQDNVADSKKKLALEKLGLQLEKSKTAIGQEENAENIQQSYQAGMSAILKYSPDHRLLNFGKKREQAELPELTFTGVEDPVYNLQRDAMQKLFVKVESFREKENAVGKSALDNFYQEVAERLQDCQNRAAVEAAFSEQLATLNNLMAAKSSAKRQLKQSMTTALQLIDQQKQLTEIEKVNRQNALKESLRAALSAVDLEESAKNMADYMNESVGKQMDGPFNQLAKGVQTNTDFADFKTLDQQKEEAVNRLQKSSEQFLLDNDRIEQDAQKNLLEQTCQAIRNCLNADQVNQCLTSSLHALSELNSELDLTRHLLENKLQRAEKNINKNPNFVSAEKAKRIKRVKEAYQNASQTLAERVSLAHGGSFKFSVDFEKVIVLQESNSGLTLAEQKEEAKDAVAAVAAQQKAVLSKVERATVDQAVMDSESIINLAMDADRLAEVRQTSLANLRELLPAQKLANQRMKEKAERVVALIQKQEQLSAIDRESRIADVQAALEMALTNVANQSQSQKVSDDDAQLDRAVLLNGDFSGLSLSEQIAEAKKQIQRISQEEMHGLSETQRLAMDSACQRSLLLLENQKTADDLGLTLVKEIQNIQELTRAKQEAHWALDQQDYAAEQAVINRNDLTAKEKIKRIITVQDALKNAFENVDQQISVEAAEQSAHYSALNMAIFKAKQANSISLDLQKAAREAAIRQMRDLQQSLLVKKQGLPHKAEESQERALENAAARAIVNIERATDADATYSAFRIGYLNLSQLLQKKMACRAQMFAQSNQAVHRIQTNDDLTVAEKMDREKQLKKVLRETLAFVDEAESDYQITNVLQNPSFKMGLDKATDFTGIARVFDRKKKAIGKLNNLLLAAAERVRQFPVNDGEGVPVADSLTTDEKSEIQLSLEKVLRHSETELEQAESASEVDDLLDGGKKCLDLLFDDMLQARLTLINTAKQAIQDLANVPELNDVEREKRTDKIQEVLRSALERVLRQQDLVTVKQSAHQLPLIQEIMDSQQSEDQSLVDVRKTAARYLQKQFEEYIQENLLESKQEKVLVEAEKQAMEQLLNASENELYHRKGRKEVAQYCEEVLADIVAFQQAKNDSLNLIFRDNQLAKERIKHSVDLVEAEKENRMEQIALAKKESLAKIGQFASFDLQGLEDLTGHYRDLVQEALDFSSVQPLEKQQTILEEMAQETFRKERDDLKQIDLAKQVKNVISENLAVLEKDWLAEIKAGRDANQLVVIHSDLQEVVPGIVKAMLSAKQLLRNKAQEADQQIESNQTFTSQEKSKRLEMVQKAEGHVEAALYQGKTRSTVLLLAESEAFQLVVKNAQSVMDSQPLNERKKAGCAQIDAAVQKSQEFVEQSTDYSSTQKQTQQSALDLIGQSAKDRVNADEDSASMVQSIKTAVDQINQLSQIKQHLYHYLRKEAVVEKDQIWTDRQLTVQDKKMRMAAIDASLNQQLRKIDSQQSVRELKALGE
ncbi:DUF1542 domain-containing protein [Fructobacillus durionis]|uniref:Uncharacterized protein n=1 Tax=Fructobacillus durionis TaxID=283737 RepID=A0A1I1FBW6_9LACO|nr:DUF1542 domain-containing protein [Fructobacillus durionis]SFB96969.1 protein of unknown function [Fructobacillus durionis]